MNQIAHSLRARGAVVVTAAVMAAVATGCGASVSGNGSPAAGVSVGTASGGNPAFALQQEFETVINAVAPTVVQVETAKGLGAGVVYDGNGDIVTNAHVVANAKTFTVTLDNGGRHSATLVGVDTANDLAVIRVAGVRPPAATFGDSSTVKSGESALAIGNPLGLRATVTQGIVSGMRQSVPEGNGVTLPLVIQTSAAINPGNSGGALVDLNGRVIGIPTLAALDPELGNGAAPGIGFAIPSNTVRSVATRLVQQSPA
jgi:S1-C subfamily serine protease